MKYPDMFRVEPGTKVKLSQMEAGDTGDLSLIHI